MIITIKVVPQASKNHIVGFYDHMLKVQLKGIPEKGKLNEELIELLSSEMGIPRSKVMIKTGLTSPIKKIHIDDAYALKADVYLNKFKIILEDED